MCASYGFVGCIMQNVIKDSASPAVDMTDYLIGLEAARHAILVDATAAISQAAFTNVLPGAGSIDVTAAVNQQILSLADVTCETLTGMRIMTD